MEFLTLQMIKQQCRVTFDYDNDLLTGYGNAAEQTIANYLHRGKKVTDMIDSLRDEYGAIPDDIYTAALMLVTNWYNHSTPVKNVQMNVVPYTFEFIIKQYIIL